MAYVNFSNLEGDSYQAPNPGGLRRVLVILSKSIEGRWPKKEDISNGEITVAPTLVAGAALAEYTFPDGTAEVTSDQQGDAGFQSFKHSIEFMVAGFSKTIQKEMASHLNAGAVYIVEMNDNQFVVAGSSDSPLFSKSSFKGGKKGADKRGKTVKGEQDGFMWDLLPLSTTAVANLELD